MEEATHKRRLIDVRNAANGLGCTPQHIYNMIKEGRIRAVRLGKRMGLRVPGEALDEFLSSRAVNPDDYHR